MNIKELSIGDWVRYIRKRKKNDDYFQVAHIFRGEKEWLVGRKNDDIFGSHSLRLKDIEPIPLTPEILEKNGWNKIVRNIKYQTWVKGGIYIRKYSAEEWYRLFIGRFEMKFNLYHTHQLQHALRLAGVGKEIVL